MHKSYRRGLSDNNIDLTIQEAVSIYFEYFAFGNKRAGVTVEAEETMQRIDALSTLLRLSQLTFSFDSVDGSKAYIIPGSYGTYRDAYATTNCGKMDIHIYGNDHVNEVLRSYHRRPSKKFKRACGFIRNGYLHIYFPAGITVESVNLYYYKQPDKVCLGTYPQIPDVGQPAGPNLPKVECDLPEKYHYLVVAIAVQELNRIYGDVNRLTIQSEKVLST